MQGAAGSVVAADDGRRIASIDELVALGRVPLILSLAPEAPLTLAMTELSNPETHRWEARLNREWTACGCREGEIASMLGIAAYCSAAALGVAPIAASTWGHAGLAALSAVAAAAVGKLVGRGRSLARFRRLTTSLAARLQPMGSVRVTAGISATSVVRGAGSHGSSVSGSNCAGS